MTAKVPVVQTLEIYLSLVLFLCDANELSIEMLGPHTLSNFFECLAIWPSAFVALVLVKNRPYLINIFWLLPLFFLRND